MLMRASPHGAQVKAGTMDKDEAQRRLRASFVDNVAAFRDRHGVMAPVKDILDMGCSVRRPRPHPFTST